MIKDDIGLQAEFILFQFSFKDFETDTFNTGYGICKLYD